MIYLFQYFASKEENSEFPLFQNTYNKNQHGNLNFSLTFSCSLPYTKPVINVSKEDATLQESIENSCLL